MEFFFEKVPKEFNEFLGKFKMYDERKAVCFLEKSHCK